MMNSNVLLLHYYNIFVKHFSFYDLENGNLFSLLILPDDLDKGILELYCPFLL